MTKVQDELVKTKTFVRLAVGVGVLLWSAALQANTTVTGEISKVGDATHLEFNGKANWNYEIKNISKTKVQLSLPAFDDKTARQLQTWKDSLVSGIKINKNGKDGKYEVTFDLESSNIESFDYLTDQPSRLIVDFYKVKASEKLSSEKPMSGEFKDTNGAFKPKVRRTVATKINKKEYTKKGDRKPAATELISVGKLKSLGGNSSKDLEILKGVYDGGDPYYSRFRIKDYEIKEESIIASRQNIYTKFPMLKLKTSKLDDIYANPPEFVIKPTEEKENKEARLLLKLYEKNRPAVFLKTYSYFTKKYPQSIYDEIIRNIYADVHYKLWKRDGSSVNYEKFKSALEYLINKYPDSVMTERLNKILAYSSLERKDGVETIQRFMRFLDNFPESSERDQAQKSLADAYLLIRKYKDSLRVLRALEKNADQKESSIEANYRLGDVYFSKGDYKRAIEHYKKSIKKNPGYEGKFGNANFNMAEAMFWSGRYQESLDHYVRFLELFPSHEHSSYALTRVGEVLDVLGADKNKVIGAYLESYYRFRNSEGSEIARVRLLSQKMKGMKEKEMQKALEEMNSIGTKSKLPRMAEFTTLMIADGLHRRKEYARGLDFLIKYYQRNPTSTDVTFFRKRILKNIGDLMKVNVDKKNFMEALKIYGKYLTTWLKTKEREDIKYFVGRSYEMAGVYREATEVYQKTLSKLKAIKGTREEKERRVNEHLPSLASVYLRLAAASSQMRKFKDSFDSLAKITETESLSPAEKVEMVELTALVAEKRGRIKMAKRNLNELIEAWQGRPELLATTFVHLANLEFKSKKYSETEEALLEVERLKEAGNEVDKEVWFKTLELKGRVLEKLGRKVAAVEAYSKILEEYQGIRPLGSIRYKAGQILFESGNIKAAEKIWNGLDPSENAMYLKLAQEKLSNAKWEDDYKKYINRIPAASRLNRSKK